MAPTKKHIETRKKCIALLQTLLQEEWAGLPSLTDALSEVEAQALAEEVGSYCFHICTVVWYDVLNQVNHLSKFLQSATMQLDVAVDRLMKAKTSLTTYRDTGFVAVFQVCALSVGLCIQEVVGTFIILHTKDWMVRHCPTIATRSIAH